MTKKLKETNKKVKEIIKDKVITKPKIDKEIPLEEMEEETYEENNMDSLADILNLGKTLLPMGKDLFKAKISEDKKEDSNMCEVTIKGTPEMILKIMNRI